LLRGTAASSFSVPENSIVYAAADATCSDGSCVCLTSHEQMSVSATRQEQAALQ
jgi:hypothetical protein